MPQTGSEAERFLTPAEAAELMGVDRKTLARWEGEGKLQAIRTAGGHRRYRYSDLQEARHRPAPKGAPQTVPKGPQGRGGRAKARRRALEVLHAADTTGSDPVAALEPDEAPAARALVEGVAAHRDAIDDVIRSAAEHWAIERMPVVDRNVLRIGVFELMRTDTPTGAVVDQAVTLAKLLSTEDSGRFVNGLLSRVAREVRE
jgi:N utilization substance protein B